MNHPNIVTIYDFFEFEGMECLVMEYIAGKTLGALIPPEGMRPEDALRIAVEVAEGLRKAHAAGIVHRDIKPSNVMVPDSGPVKILDFGLAKLTGSETLTDDDSTRAAGPPTEEGTVLGTISYMSPEQAQGKPVDSRSDIFSFGSVLYEMLTGRRAFRQDSTVGTAGRHPAHRSPPPVSPNLPRAVSRILFKCLRKNPEDRWQDIANVKQLLEDAAKDNEATVEHIEPGPQTAGAPRARRFAWPVVAAACAAGALLAYAILRVLPGTGSSRLANNAVFAWSRRTAG